VNKYWTPNDCEKGWEELVTYYGVKDKKWAIELFNDKEKWAEAYLRGFFLQVRKLSFYICLSSNIVVDILYVSFLYSGMRSTQRCESMHRTIKASMDPGMKLYRLVQLYNQVIEELPVQDGHNDYMTLHTYPVIRGILCNVKAHAATIYIRNCYGLLCKEMSFESMYVMKGEKQKQGGVEEPVYYWL